MTTIYSCHAAANGIILVAECCGRPEERSRQTFAFAAILLHIKDTPACITGNGRIIAFGQSLFTAACNGTRAALGLRAASWLFHLATYAVGGMAPVSPSQVTELQSVRLHPLIEAQFYGGLLAVIVFDDKVFTVRCPPFIDVGFNLPHLAFTNRNYYNSCTGNTDRKHFSSILCQYPLTCWSKILPYLYRFAEVLSIDFIAVIIAQQGTFRRRHQQYLDKSHDLFE